MVDFAGVLPAWWLALSGALAAGAAAALGGGVAGPCAQRRARSRWRPGRAGDLFDDIPPLRALRGHPLRLCVVLALAERAARSTLVEWHAEHSLAEGLQRGVAEALAFDRLLRGARPRVGARR